MLLKDLRLLEQVGRELFLAEVIWDHRCTVHQALGDYDRKQIRYMRRTAVKGNASGYALGV